MTQSPQRNLWPTAIISFFAVFITALVIFIVWGVRQDMDLVRGDYYEHEVRYQQQMDRLQRSQLLEASIDYNSTTQTIQVHLPKNHALSQASGSIHLYRPSDAKLDHKVKLALNPNGIQQVSAQSLREGLWKVQVSWKVNDEEFYLNESVVIERRRS